MTEKPVAVVTGASRGAGFLLAREVVDRGHDLVVCARSEEGLATAAAELQGRGAQVVTVPADVSVEDDARRVVETARERFGRLDLLVTTRPLRGGRHRAAGHPDRGAVPPAQAHALHEPAHHGQPVAAEPRIRRCRSPVAPIPNYDDHRPNAASIRYDAQLAMTFPAVPGR